MKTSSIPQVALAVTAIVAFVGITLATVVNNSSTGLHELTLNSSTNTLDTGVGLFTLNNLDSSVRNGIFFANGRLADTWLAVPGTVDGRGGSGRLISGKAASSLNSVSTFYIQMSDTARTSVSTTFTDASTSSGSWSGTFTNNSGTCTSKFGLPGGRFSSTAIQFGDSTSPTDTPTGDTFYYSNAMRSGDSVTIYDTTLLSFMINIRIAVIVRSGIDSNVNDTMRIIVINSAGKVAGDSQMIRTAGVTSRDTTWQSPVIRLETGVNKVVIVYWDAAQAKYAFKVGQINVGTYDWRIAVDGTTVTYEDTTASPAVGQLTRFDLHVQNNVTPNVVTAQTLDPSGDGAARSDNYAPVDSNTSGFDTRLARTVFAINLFDAGGNPITKITGGKFLLVVKYNFGGLSSTQASNIRLLHRNSSTNSWDVVSASAPDSASRTLVAYVDEFSEFALGSVSSSGSSTVGTGNGNCIVNNAIGGTGMAGIMPPLRGVRDTLLSSAIGRWITAGYYNLAAGLCLAFVIAGFGAFAVGRKIALGTTGTPSR